MRELTDEYIGECRRLANDLKLEGRGLLWAEPAVIRRVCNGIGAEWMPEKLRGVLDTIHPAFVVPSIIHDLQYYYWNGAKSTFFRVNADFAENGKKMARHLYGWHSPRRYLAYHTANKYKTLLDLFGEPAAKAARAQRMLDTEANANG